MPQFGERTAGDQGSGLILALLCDLQQVLCPPLGAVTVNERMVVQDTLPSLVVNSSNQGFQRRLATLHCSDGHRHVPSLWGPQLEPGISLAGVHQ